MKKEGYIYCITHLPSSKQYVGKYNKNPRIRFMEHLCGYGSICIWDLICQGESENNFKLEILERDVLSDKQDKLEAEWVKKLDCAFPKGLNASFSGTFYKFYKGKWKEASDNKWCLKLLDCVIIDKQTENSKLQEHILLLAKNQTDINIMSEESMREWRMNRRRGYSRKNVFLTKDMSAFFEAREKEYERIRSKNFTEAEIKAQSTRSESMKMVWANRDSEERAKILKNATESAAIKNRKQNED